MKFSRIKCFIDESGQFARGKCGIKVMAGLLTHDKAENAKHIADYVKYLRTQYGKNGVRLKAAGIPSGEYVQFAHIVKRHKWLVIDQELDLNADFDRGTKEHLLYHVSLIRNKLRYNNRLDLRIDMLVKQIEEMSPEQIRWALCLNTMAKNVCKQFKAWHLCPVGEFVLDEKLPASSNLLAGFLVRMAIMVNYPEVFKGNLAMVYGVDDRHSNYYRVRVSQDEKDDGLLLADICAYVLGSLARDKDKAPRDHHMFKEILSVPMK